MVKYFSEEEDLYIKNNYLNKSYDSIATTLGRSVKSISQRARRLKLLNKNRYRSENKQTINTIGSRRRANNKYNGILSRIKYTERKKNSNYCNVKLKVSREEFIKWYMPLDFKGASVDRIDNNGDYELSNMQVISLKENIIKDKVKCKDGFCECYVCHKTKPIELFAKDRRRTNGYSTICKDCDNKRHRKNGQIKH